MTSAMQTTEWLEGHNGRYQLHPMMPQPAISAHPPMIVAKGDGVYVSDIHGKRYIDCQGGLWCVTAGHGRTEIIDAIKTQLDQLQYYTVFPGSTNVPSIELSAKLCELASEERITKVFFSQGGSDAVESAFKIARQYWKIEGQPQRFKFLSLRNGYHGLHFGGMSAGGNVAWKASYEPLMAGFYQVESPHLYRNPFTDSDPEFLTEMCIRMLEREIEHQGPDSIAALIAEPVQGAGGVIVPPASYWPRLREVCDRYGILLISDEVITGLGRTGALFGCRGWGVRPDLMCMAKGLTSGYLPLGATLIGERVASAFDKGGDHGVYMHGYTYSGHPVACAAGIAAVDLTLREKLTENAADVGAYFLAALREKIGGFAPVGDIRGKGLAIAIELVKDRKSKEAFGPTDAFPQAISEFCVSHGVIIRCIVNKLIISPPLTFTRALVDEVVEILRKAFTTHRP